MAAKIENAKNQEKGIHEKTAFLISPIGSDGTETRVKVDGLIDVIAPVLKKFELELLASHKISKSGSINKQIIEHLLYDKLVICNLTNLNPNVMYELGIRHSKMLPVILVAEKGTDNPFDVSDMRTIAYEDKFRGVKTFKRELRKAIKETLEAENQDNPVSAVVGRDSIIKMVETKGTNTQKILYQQVAELHDKMDRMISNQNAGDQSKRVLGLSSVEYRCTIRGDKSDLMKFMEWIFNDPLITEFINNGFQCTQDEELIWEFQAGTTAHAVKREMEKTQNKFKSLRFTDFHKNVTGTVREKIE